MDQTMLSDIMAAEKKIVISESYALSMANLV